MSTMFKTLFSLLKPLARPVLALALVGVLVFSQADTALAARSGGRIGGGSFRRPMPSRSYSSPRGYQQRPMSRGGYGYGGGGFGFPFLLPFFGFGGVGSIFSILIFIAIANFLVTSFRRISSSEEGFSLGDSSGYDGNAANPITTINKLQIGLLASARDLQKELDAIALKANTGSPEGLQKVLQETTLALMRHPQYWVYGGVETEQQRLASAEARFNHLALTERSKFQAETLSNVKTQLQQSQSQAFAKSEAGELLTQDPGEYIVVTLLTGSQGKLNLPKISDNDDMRLALSQMGAIGSEQLLALEVYWTPQAEGDAFTAEDLITDYPHLKHL